MGAVLLPLMRLTHLCRCAVLCCPVQCCCLSWNMQRRDLFLSSSWDDSIKLYSIHNPASMQTFLGHSYCVYHVAWWVAQRCSKAGSSTQSADNAWQQALLQHHAGSHCHQVIQAPPLPVRTCRSPAHGDVFLSASGDTTVRLWDLRQPQPTLVLPAHAFEVLSADWCKYNDCIIATGSIDKTIKIWDVRQPQRELTTLFGHS